jgi:predicted nucleic acid-binding protein
MSIPFVDTDVIIRLLANDDLGKQAAAAALFQKVREGQLQVAAPDTVIADAVYVLASPRLYRLSRQMVRQLLAPLVQLPGFKIRNRRAVLRALDLYASANIDFGDALILASLEQADSQVIYSYDHDFENIKGITRRAP